MGVHGLTTYVESQRNLLKDVKFRDSRLVIDGCSLFYRLYFNHGLDQQRGGDYDQFSHVVHQFFTALDACNIQPYVVLDGGMDPSDKKFVTLRQRLQSKIKEADNLSHGRGGSVLPILAPRAMIQVITQRGVPLVQCPAEADWEIACLAFQWKCPVLTSDSDFYIFDLPGGYLPFQFFHWTNLSGKAPNRYISARCYTASGLCQWFGSVHCDILALSAVLLGNDYGSPKEADKVFAMLNDSGFMAKGRASASRIDALLLYLFSFRNATEALEEVSEIMAGGKKREKHVITSKLREGMQEYSINTHSSLAHWFSEAGSASLGGQTSQLPECLSLVEARGLLSPWVLDAFVMHRVFLVAQVENSKLASSHCCSTAIRQALYGILLQNPRELRTHRGGGAAQQMTGPHCGVPVQDRGPQGNVSQGRRGGRGRGGRGQGGRGLSQSFPTQQGANAAGHFEQAVGTATAGARSFSTPIVVDEYHRLDLNFTINRMEVQPLRNHIQLDEIAEAPAAVRLGVILDVLGVSEIALAPVPPHMQLSVAVTAFWMQKAIPTPSQLQLQALLLCMVYGELSWSSQSSRNQHNINWAAERRVQAGLDRHRVRAGERRGLDLAVAHSLSQWQACLWSTLGINQLLLLPLPEPHVPCLFSGTLVHGLFRYLKGGRTPESLLAGGAFSGQIYSSLLSSVKNCGPNTDPSSSSSGRRRRSRGQGRRGRGARGRGRGVDDISNRFALLMSEEEFDNE